MTRPTDKQLIWRESRDQHKNSTHEALSITWGDAAGRPFLYWRAKCILRDNEAVWTLADSDPALIDAGCVVRPLGRQLSADDALALCQSYEDDIRAQLGEGMPPMPEPEPEEPPLVLSEDGFAPTTKVRARWSRNEGSLRLFRVWKQPESDLEQLREITDNEEFKGAAAAYFTQRMVEEAVTRMATGGFGRLLWETPFATAHMQCEMEFVNVSAFTVTIRRGGKAEDLAVKPPTHDEICRVVARQMHERKLDLDAKIGNADEAALRKSIERHARDLGLAVDTPTPTEDDGGRILPITLEDIQRGGGNILDPGQKGGAK